MEKWVLVAVGLIISSVVLYLFIRKSKDVGLSVDIQNLGMFLPPTVFIGIYNLLQKKSFQILPFYLIIIGVAAFFFSWLGNIASLKALKKAPNPGYSLIISKSYVLMTSILAVWIFGSSLTVKSIIAIVLIVLFSAMIIIDKRKNHGVEDSTWIWLTFGAFLAWGFLALTLKYLTNQGLESTTILFYLMLIVSVLISTQLFIKRSKVQFKKSYLSLFLLIGVASTFFNLFTILGYQYAPNPGYINAANAGSIALVTIFSAWLFKDELSLKKVIGVLGVISSLLLLFI